MIPTTFSVTLQGRLIEIDPELFDESCNAFECLKHGLDSGIDDSKNVIGASDSLCPRATIIKKLFGNTFNGNAKTLMGEIYEEALYKPDVLDRFLNQIDVRLGIESKIRTPQKEALIEIIPGYYLRLHPDIYTENYIVEVKTTSVYDKLWVRELASYQVEQLNTYLGVFKKPIGFLHKINVRGFQSNISEWETLWKKYGYTIPIKFNPELFKLTLLRVYNVLNLIKKGKWNVSGPVFSWECKNCDVVDQCGKIKIKCEQMRSGKPHYYFMYEWENVLTKEFLDDPICHLCYADSGRRKPYAEYKYKAEYQQYFKEDDKE